MPPNAASSKGASKARIVPAIPRSLVGKPRDKVQEQNVKSASLIDEQVSARHNGVVAQPAPAEQSPATVPSSSQPEASKLESKKDQAECEPELAGITAASGDASEPSQRAVSDISRSPLNQEAVGAFAAPAVIASTTFQRSELPPDFIPAQTLTRLEASEGLKEQNFATRGSTGTENMHHPRSSTNSLALGGPNESIDSQQGYANTFGPNGYGAPPNGSLGPVPHHMSPVYPNGHGHHLSEPPIGPGYGPAHGHYQYAGSPGNNLSHSHALHRGGPGSGGHAPQYNRRPRADDYGYGQYSGMPYNGPASGYFPGARPGMEREPPRPFSGSFGEMMPPPQGSLHASFGPSPSNAPLFRGLPIGDAGRQPNGFTPESLQADAGGRVMPEFLLQNFGNAEFADYFVHISHAAYLFNPVRLAAHGVVMARSPKLRSLMAMQRLDSNFAQPYPRSLEVQLSDRAIIDFGAVNSVLRHLYGEPLLQMQHASLDPVQAMQFSLSYAAAGHFFEMDEVIMRGLDIATHCLHLSNVVKALSFALEGGLSSAWNQPDGINQEDRASSSSIDGSSKLDSPTAVPTYGAYSSHMLKRVVDFLLKSLTSGYRFNPSAPQLVEIPRLPNKAEPRHLRSGSRLSQIRFGDLDLADKGEDERTNTTLSSICLSLPFSVLKIVLEHVVVQEALGSQNAFKLAEQVIEERETRRERALASKDGSAVDVGLEERLWHNTSWRETAEADERGGPRLGRQRVAAGTLASATASNNKF